MMAMVITMVHEVEVLLEVMVMVVWLEEDKVRLCVINVIRLDIWLEIVGTQLRRVDIAEQLIMSLSSARS